MSPVSAARLLALAACLIAALALTGCPPPAQQASAPTSTPSGAPATPAATGSSGGEIVLGSYMCNTGSFATFGQSSTKAMNLAVEEINAAGGVLGKKIRLVVEDDQCKPEEAANAAQKLINQDKVLCVIGEATSTNSLAAGPICQSAGVPMVSPAATNPQVTQVGDYVFRVCFTDDFQGTVMARFATETLKAKTAIIFSDVSSDYSKGLAKAFREGFTAAGGKIVAEESYSQGDKDFRALLTRAKSLNPDVMWIPGYYSEIAVIMSQARQLGVKAPGMGGDGWDSPKLVEIGGAAVDGCYFSNHYSKDDTNPVVQTFVKNYQAKYNEVPDAFGACAYDAIRIVCDAIGRVGKEDPKALRDALAATRDFDGVTGKITIDANRNASKPAAILTIKDGKQAFVQTMTAQ